MDLTPQQVDHDIIRLFSMLPEEFDAKRVGQWLRSEQLEYNKQQIGYALKRLLHRRMIERIAWSASKTASSEPKTAHPRSIYRLVQKKS